MKDQRLDLILLDPHERFMRSLLDVGAGEERAAYALFGLADIDRDPWTKQPRRRLISHSVRGVPATDVQSASGEHITWQTDGFMRLLGDAMDQGLVPALVHTHPGGIAQFSKQDTRNETELARTAMLKGVEGLLSIVVAGNGGIAVRYWWSQTEHHAVRRILYSGPRLSLQADREASVDFLDRQSRLFGKDKSDGLTRYRCGIAGGGATGSAVLVLLQRLGIRQCVMFERDYVETTNLNRLHGARRQDAKTGVDKLTIHERTVRETNLGMAFVPVQGFAGEAQTWEALKACDVIFGCTDDHAGRLFLNRFARYYGISVIDVGLAMQRRSSDAFDLFARVSTLTVGHPCLLCGGFVDSRRAQEESLQRQDPEGYTRLKEEAYVRGEGDPSPAVVSFTTEAACMAVNEWLAGAAGITQDLQMVPTRVRRFHGRDERFPHVESRSGCPACHAPHTLGRGDVQPFLGRMS